jgi:hypothetical protein
MNDPENDKPDTEALDYLLGVVKANRDKRCAELRAAAAQQRKAIIGQAHTTARTRMHHHVLALREKYRERTTAAHARNQALFRQRQNASDKVMLDVAWPMLRQAIESLWHEPATRRKWLTAVIREASSKLMKTDWRIEHADDLSEEDKRYLESAASELGREVVLIANDDIGAGIRIDVDGTIIDATLDGVLKQRTMIEAMLIARSKRDIS